jgi:hypothetical protein
MTEVDETVPHETRAESALRNAQRMLGNNDVAIVHGLTAIGLGLLAVVERLDLLIARIEEVER